MPQYRPIFERFAEKFECDPETGCWNWTGAKVAGGYGQLHGERGAPNVPAHVFSYNHHIAPVPAGKIVRHSCDNPACVNPEHLLLGTHADNMADMKDRMRAIGSWKGSRRFLTDEERDEVVRLLAAGERVMVVAKRFGADRKTIRNIRPDHIPSPPMGRPAKGH